MEEVAVFAAVVVSRLEKDVLEQVPPIIAPLLSMVAVIITGEAVLLLN